MDPVPEPVLLMADGFGEFVRLIGGTDVPVGVESLSVIIWSSPDGLGNGESCRCAMLLVKRFYLFRGLDRYL